MTSPALLLTAVLRAYQWTIRPLIPGACRFEPGCSEYAVQAVREHGAGRGSVLAAWRVLRCNPFCDGGYDPVPPCGCQDAAQPFLNKWILKASLERSPEAEPLALLPASPSPAPSSLQRSPV
ncbi:MAG: membrane protein insertion efficiency factor YidD [Janthinobacterium lividum]